MQTDNRLFDDLARMANGAVGSLQGVREDVESRLKNLFERFAGEMDLVTREEFDAVKAMATKAREQNEALEKRIAELETRLGAAGTSSEMPAPTSSGPAATSES
jgi:BMFP domain-containing protein YqiC